MAPGPPFLCGLALLTPRARTVSPTHSAWPSRHDCVDVQTGPWLKFETPACAAVKPEAEEEWGRDFGEDDVNTFRLIFVGATFLSLPAEAQEHRFEDDPIMTVRENFVACDVLSQLQRVMADPRFLLAGM